MKPSSWGARRGHGPVSPIVNMLLGAKLKRLLAALAAAAIAAAPAASLAPLAVHAASGTLTFVSWNNDVNHPNDGVIGLDSNNVSTGPNLF